MPVTRLHCVSLQCLSVEMRPRPLRGFAVALLLLSLVPSALSFSRGASRASCWTMVPAHIVAQPQELHRGHVALRSSASSYLPGQFITG